MSLAPYYGGIKPAHGWTCFHCGETFTQPHAARQHFGYDQGYEPACIIKAGAERSMVEALRRAEASANEAWAIVHAESTEMAKAYSEAAGRYSEQLRLAEELGYERGLRDAEKEASIFNQIGRKVVESLAHDSRPDCYLHKEVVRIEGGDSRVEDLEIPIEEVLDEFNKYR